MKKLFDYIKQGHIILISLVLALTVFALMIFGPLATLEQIAGQKPFDLRPQGYNLQDAQNLIAALGEPGKNIYLLQQLPLDFIYPALLAVFMAGALLRLSTKNSITTKFYLATAYLAFGAGLADYLENALIAIMLTSAPDLSSTIVNLASIASIIKASLTTLVSIVLLIAIIEFSGRKLLGWKQR